MFRLYFLALLLTVSSTLSVTAQSGINIALNKPVVVSSYESESYYPAAAAVDGKANTRWSSQWNHDPEWLYVDLGTARNIERVKLSWERAYGKDYQIQVSNDAATWTTVRSVTGNTSLENNLTALRATGRYVRLYGTARGNGYGYSLYEIEIYENVNLAYQKTATASSSHGNNSAALAFDNNPDTRWESQHNHDPEWLSVDLGAVQTVQAVKLTWETAAASDFTLETSLDAKTWTVIQRVKGNTSLTNDYTGFNTNARYVRMYGTARTTQYGYSLYEFEVYGKTAAYAPLPVSLTSFKAQATANGVRVQWTTATEKDNAGFDVERSSDGTTFKSVAFVAGAGTSTTAHTYEYLDARTPAQVLYYRLKQTDTDGTTTYTAVATVQPQAVVTSVALYPNPAAASTTLTWTATAAEMVTVVLTDGQGHTLWSQPTTAQPGSNLLPLDLTAYKPGLYFVSLRSTQATTQAKVVKL